MKPMIVLKLLIVIWGLFYLTSGWSQEGRYTVQPGDNPSKIAKKLCGKESKLQEIQKANPEINLTKNKKLQVDIRNLQMGQVLIIPCQQPLPPALPTKSKSTTEKKNLPEIQWTLVTAWPKYFPIFHDGCNRFAADVKAMSEEKLSIKVLALDEKGFTLPELFKAVSTGTVEMGHSAAYYWANDKKPESQFFSAIPFGMTAKGSNAWLYSGGGLALWRELYEKHNLYPFPMGNSGTQMGGWFKKKIQDISSFRGLKMRMGGYLSRKVLEKTGSIVQQLPAGQIVDAFKDGRIDTAEWIGPHHDKSLGLPNVAKYYYYPGWQEPSTTLELIINKDKWKSLTPDLQKIIEVASGNINQWMYAQFESLNPTALRIIKEQNKVEVVEFPPEVLAKLHEYTQQVMEKEAENRPEFKKIYDSYERFRKENDEWGKISEDAYKKIQK